MLESFAVQKIELTADELSARLLSLSDGETVCMLDSCGVGHLGSHLMFAGIRPVEVLQISNDDPHETLRVLTEKLSGAMAGMFTISYDFGLKLQGLHHRKLDRTADIEPDVFLALFDTIAVHDYDTKRTRLVGDASRFEEVFDAIMGHGPKSATLAESPVRPQPVTSNFTRSDYLAAVERIREYIRSGDTYQANLTQQLRSELHGGVTAQTIFQHLRSNHPAPFASFIKRDESYVVSASPERFFRVSRAGAIETSPIKGTRPRGATAEEDYRLRAELESSEKDRAENTMIVDLMRNDLGRVCEFGSVEVEKLCGVEEHPTLFHLVSTVRGKLRSDVRFSHILRAVFPCGSITGAPKIRTMQIIDEIEPSSRGLSMGAIGIYLPATWDVEELAIDTVFDLSVAIRTMVVRDGEAVFNVGGGIVIDSDPANEFDESMLKSKALVDAIRAELDS
jgi:para-aminobenzoate synthetase component 1